jgi:hypothetical protein
VIGFQFLIPPLFRLSNALLCENSDSNHVRHIKFIAMRDDKDSRKVVKEN